MKKKVCHQFDYLLITIKKAIIEIFHNRFIFYNLKYHN